MRRLLLGVLRWTLFAAVMACGFTAFMVLAGDCETLTPTAFILWKAGSMAALAGTCLAGRALYRRGLFPGIITREIARAMREEA
ncbi:MAG: hypothetical protein LUC24_03390 [Bacteroidales bacterium]|nr:hypothetical protein [Bacteroidales bacterium]